MRIVLSGWNPGFNKVGLTKLLRAQLGHSLRRAKTVTDAVLEGQLVTVEVADGEAKKFINQINSLGLKWNK
jgi:ribosomal protein L7/L12